MWVVLFSASTQKSFDPVLEPVANTVSFQDVRDPPRWNLARVPVHDRHEVERGMNRHRFEAMPRATPHRQGGDVRAPDLVRTFHRQPSKQIWIGLEAPCRPAGVGFLVDRHQAHQPPNPLLVHPVSVVTQMPGHLPDAEERGLQGIARRSAASGRGFVRPALGRVGERRARD